MHRSPAITRVNLLRLKWVNFIGFYTWTTGINYKTATLSGSVSTNSKMYVRTSGISAFNPDPSAFTSGTVLLTDYLFINGSLIVSTSLPPFLGCATSGGGGGGSAPTPAITLLENVALDGITYSSFDGETKYNNKNQLYRLLKADPSLKSSSIILQDFYDLSTPTVRETFINIEDDIAMGDLVNSQIKTSALSPLNTIEDNYKTFFNTYLKQQTDTIFEEDSLTILSMANSCPFTDGDMVYQARALYNSIYKTNIYFEDNCPDLSAKSVFYEYNAKTASSSFDVLVYPNPNSGSFSLIPFSSDIKKLNLRVVDVNGKTVYSSLISSHDRVFNLGLDCPNGIYMLFVNNPETKEAVVKRIIIQK